MASFHTWVFSGIGTLVVASAAGYFGFLGGERLESVRAFAQGNQSISGNNNSINNQSIGDGSVLSGINDSTIQLIFREHSGEVDNPEIKNLIDQIGRLLASLDAQGKIAITEEGASSLSEGLGAILSDSPLRRNIVSQRQFSVRVQKNYSIAGTRTRLAYLSTCTFIDRNGGGRASRGVLVRLNSENSRCIIVGTAIPFSIAGQQYELVLDEFDRSRAHFTIY